MKLAGLNSVGACWCVLFSAIAVSSSLKPPPGPLLVGSSIANDEVTPATFTLTFSYKDTDIVKSCSGAYIQKDRFSKVHWILPAECVDETQVNRTVVSYGGYHVFDKRWYFFELSYISHHIHPNYDRNTKAHNIAIVTPPSMTYLPLSNDYKSIQFPNTTDDFGTSNTLGLYEYAWSIEKPGPTAEPTLMSVKTRIMHSFWCKILYPFSPIKHNVCASGFFNKGLSENGLGTPLIAWDGENFKLVGLATVVRPWTHKYSFPMEFLSIRPYMDWIESVIYSI